MPLVKISAPRAWRPVPLSLGRVSFAPGAWWLLAVCAGLVAGVVAFQLRPVPRKVPPVFGQLPAFHLVERSGRPVSSGDLRGHVWIADFFFSNCPGPCLTMTQRMAQLHRALPNRVRFVSVTIDPLTDQPAVLNRYAARFGVGADDQTWLFLTGEQESIYRLAREGFHLAASGPAAPDFNGPEATPLAAFLHSTRFALVDGGGRVRGFYDSTDEDDLRRLSADARLLQ